ncbi:MAG TPA: metallophosphoesterase [Candidatus Limnocylindria bacterium]|nr:metallophosphoesterase [Candidatus Limnocylindria bacterium]
MSELLHLSVPALAVGTYVGVPLYAWRRRGRAYAIFELIVLSIALPGTLFLHHRLAVLLPPAFVAGLDAGFAYGMATACAHMMALVRARLRPRPFRWLISRPGMAFIATGALAGLWLLLLLPLRTALVLGGFERALMMLGWLDLVPLVVGAASVFTSMRLPHEIVRFPLDGVPHPTITRLPTERHRRRAPAAARRPLRIVQITDPHLGPWQPVHRLQRRLERLVQHDPDLVLLTGDFLTLESQNTPGALAAALAPLARISDRCFATFGNHDHEAPDEVRHGLVANGIHLLLDDAIVTRTAVGEVQIVGADWVARDHAAHLAALFARHPRRDGALRLLLMHSPIGFRHIPPGEVDLVLSGHFHGGQLGLVSMGFGWTVLSRTQWPDHGLFGQGTNRLYVHRGTGFYGFPLRVGVPGEASVLEVLVDAAARNGGAPRPLGSRS